MVYVSWILYEQLYNFLLYPNFWEINFKSSTESPVDKFLLHSKSLSLYLSQEQTLWGASPGLLQLYNVRSPCKWYSTFNWLSLPVSQRSLSTCSPLTLVLAQWFCPSWLSRAMSCETCSVIIEKLSFAFPLRVKQQASVILSWNHEDLVMLLLFHWFLLLKTEMSWNDLIWDKFWFDFWKKPGVLPFCPVLTNCYTCCTKHSRFVQQSKTKRRCTTSEVLSMMTSPLQIHNQPVA